MNQPKSVLCVGEVLWDGLPSGLFLGGAPLNVCHHLNQLDLNGIIASRVGEDRLGYEALRRIDGNGMDVSLIQRDATHETGFVEVTLDRTGNAEYEFIEPAAWDRIVLTDSLSRYAGESWAIVFGTLAQRATRSRETIHALLQSSALNIYDVNFRFPHVDRDHVNKSLKAADILKLNKEELDQIIRWFGLSATPEEAIRQLSDRFQLELIAVTYGSRGATLYWENSIFKTGGLRIEVEDSVGAGDAFVAALIAGWASGKEGRELLSFANAVGAFTASKSGATPTYRREQFE